jgi:hypothetical protein
VLFLLIGEARRHKIQRRIITLVAALAVVCAAIVAVANMTSPRTPLPPELVAKGVPAERTAPASAFSGAAATCLAEEPYRPYGNKGNTDLAGAYPTTQADAERWLLPPGEFIRSPPHLPGQSGYPGEHTPATLCIFSMDAHGRKLLYRPLNVGAESTSLHKIRRAYFWALYASLHHLSNGDPTSLHARWWIGIVLSNRESWIPDVDGKLTQGPIQVV